MQKVQTSNTQIKFFFRPQPSAKSSNQQQIVKKAKRQDQQPIAKKFKFYNSRLWLWYYVKKTRIQWCDDK